MSTAQRIREIVANDRRTLLSYLVATVFFMENLDATVITTSLPAMARDFGVAASNLSVGVSAYLVALTVFIPLSGWMTSRFGPRRIFTSAIVIFMLGSLLCAMSEGLVSFSLARLLQGIGGAMMVPVGRLVVLRDTPKNEIVKAIAILTWPALTAPVLGPPIGGWISTHWSWPWIFLLNLPLGLICLGAAFALVRDSGITRQPFDLPGLLLSGFGFTSFMIGLELASRVDLPRGYCVLALVAGCVLLGFAARHLNRAEHPLLNLAPLRIPTFRVTALGGSVFRTCIGSAPFLLPLAYQLGFGWSAVKAGTLLLWLFAGNLAIKPATTRIMRGFGFRRVLVVNGLLVSVGFAGCALIGPDTPYVVIAALMCFTGVTRSIQFTALNTIGFSDVPDKHMRDATTLFSVLQQMNAGMGIAVGALVLAIAEGFLHGGTTGTPQLADFRLTFWILCGIALMGLIDSVQLPKNAGESVLKK